MNKAQELAQIVNKQLGTDTLKMGSDESLKVHYLPTGVEPFDDLMDGGIPYGRSVTIFGAFSTLKTYLGLCAIREAQRRDQTAVLIDTEHAYDPEWAEHIGVDTDALIYQQPETGEEALDLADALIRGSADLIVFDSVAATLPQAEQTKRLHKEQTQPARQADLMSKGLRKLTAANKNTAILWINQVREQVGVTFGSNEKQSGGRALPFYSSWIVKITKSGTVREDVELFADDYTGKPAKRKGKRTVAQTVKVTVDKSKLSVPHREMYFTFDLRSGTVDTFGYLLNRGLEQGKIQRKGGYWWIKGEKYRPSEIRDRMSLSELRTSLSPGSHAPDSRKGDAPKKKLSKKKGPNSTR